jgi:hypothetical protein
MIFIVHQLVEISWEYKSKAYFTIIYHSVSSDAKLGVSEENIRISRSFHQDIRPRIHLDGETVEEIQVQNGLRQDCCMALVLFNL